MKSWLLLLLTTLFSFAAHSHNYYFGFAEMQYNPLNKTLETTLVLAAHDFEDYLVSKGHALKDLEFLTEDPAAIAIITQEATAGFTVQTGGQNIMFEGIGFEVSTNGLISIYLLARHVIPGKTLNIGFSCLMEIFPEQQNKLTFICNSRKYTAVFLPGKKTDVITIE